MQTELSGKRLELLKELIPSIRLVAVIWNPTDPPAAGVLRETEAAARSLGVKVHAIARREACIRMRRASARTGVAPWYSSIGY
jgi:ABC-type uncharacterized transport system substrate-binding protein